MDISSSSFWSYSLDIGSLLDAADFDELDQGLVDPFGHLDIFHGGDFHTDQHPQNRLGILPTGPLLQNRYESGQVFGQWLDLIIQENICANLGDGSDHILGVEVL